MIVGQEYRPPFYGHVFMFGMRDHLISPFATGYEGHCCRESLPEQHRHAAQGQGTGRGGRLRAFVLLRAIHSKRTWAAPKGFLVDAALGTTDALEWSLAQNGFPPLYAAWSNGLAVTAVGGEDSISDLPFSSMLGSMRTYVRTADRELSLDGWLEGLVAGRAWVSNGPLLDVTVDRRDPGETVQLDEPGSVKLKVSVTSITPLDRLLVVRDGEVLEEIPFEGDRKSLAVERTIEAERSTWIHVRAEGKPQERAPLDARYAQAFTNPVWVEVGGRPVRSEAAADYALRWVDKLEGMAEEHPGWRSDAEKEHVLQQFEEARSVYRARRTEAQP